MIQRAAAFAAKAHEGVVRKGSRLPYIVHPMEVAMIVSVMTDDPEIIAAAYLHDVIEDAGVTYQELETQFGHRIAELVLEESEDKKKNLERTETGNDRPPRDGRPRCEDDCLWR